MSDHPTSRQRAAVLLRAAMSALNDLGGDLPRHELFDEVEKRVQLTNRDREVMKSGAIRWRAILHFSSVECVKAGYIKKSGGRWFLTPEGKSALGLPAEQVILNAEKAFRAWRAEKEGNQADIPIEEPATEAAARSLVFETAEAQALEEIKEYVSKLGPYEFQDLVAALLRGMGYSVPFVAPRGPDGGIDIIAYRDPLGLSQPHIRVQVKHRKDKASREEIAALRGIVRSDREIGLFVSTNGFTNDAQRDATTGNVHIELVDLSRFLELWIRHYDQLTDDDRSLLRLRRVYFLAPD